MTDKTKEPYLEWNPAQNYVWTRKQLHQWAEQTAGMALYNGQIWDIVYKLIVPDRYQVSFKKRHQ